MPKWLPRANELPPADRRRRLHGDAVRGGPRRPAARGHRPCTSSPPAPTPSAASALFRLAWDFVGSELGGRGELYERFYLLDSWRMTALAYNIADKTLPEALVEQFLED